MFSTSPVEGYLEYFRESTYFPVAGMNQLGPYQFHVPAMSSLFVDLQSAYWEGSVRILEQAADGTVKPCTTKDTVIPCNLLPGSLFNQTDVSFNGLMVSYVSSPLGKAPLSQL